MYISILYVRSVSSVYCMYIASNYICLIIWNLFHIYIYNYAHVSNSGLFAYNIYLVLKNTYIAPPKYISQSFWVYPIYKYMTMIIYILSLSSTY